MPTDKVYVAIIGVGSIANKYAEALALTPGVVLFAGCCRTYEKKRL